MPVERISKVAYYLDIARAVAKRSTCLRRQYGCVLVKLDEIVATGYNGAPRGQLNCCDAGFCYRKQCNVPHGQRYELCVAVHAEQNAIISAARAEMLGGTAFLAGFDLETGEEIDAVPCRICARMLMNAGIEQVINRQGVLSPKTLVESDTTRAC